MKPTYLNQQWDTSLLENCFVMYPKVTGGELLKYAVIELIIAEVLTLKMEKKRPNPQAPITRYFYLKKGPLFDKVKTRHYHKPIMNIFKRQKDYLPLRHFGERMNKLSNGNMSYFKNNFVYQAMKKEGLLNSSFLFMTFLSKRGKDIKRYLKPEFEYAEKKLNNLLKDNSKEAIGLVNTLDLDLILMDKLSYKSAKIITQLLSDSTNKLRDDLLIRSFNFLEVFEFENSFSISIDFRTFIGEHRPPRTNSGDVW